MNLVCSQCSAVNRVPEAKLQDKPVCGIPTMILFRGGREVVRQAGAMNAAQIAAFARGA